MENNQGQDAGQQVVYDNAGSTVNSLVGPADGKRFGDVKEAKEDKCRKPGHWTGRNPDKSDEHAGDLVNDDDSGVFAVNNLFGRSCADYGKGDDPGEGYAVCCRCQLADEKVNWKGHHGAPGAGCLGEIAGIETRGNEHE